MKICLLGDFSSNRDEGFKNISHYLADQLDRQNIVFRFNIKHPAWMQWFSEVISKEPDIIHILTKPTLSSLIVSQLIDMKRRNIRIVISGLKTHSFIAYSRNRLFVKCISRRWKPDLFLIQSKQAEKFFNAHSWNIRWLWNGVDWRRFYPLADDERKKLIMRYGLDASKPIILHIGHVQVNRNLLLLEELSKYQVQLVVIGSTYLGCDQRLISKMKQLGCIYYLGYQPSVVDFYRLADCYVFPVSPGNSIDTPLSVLEAMACNLPIVTTRFSGLEALFCEGNGFYFFDNPEQFCAQVMEALNSEKNLATRDMVLPYSWPAIADQLQHYYQELFE